MDKKIEPFNLVGERSLILTKEEAAEILKDNSYYLFIASGILLGAWGVLLVTSKDISVSKCTIFMAGIYFFILGLAVRYLRSRIASILALVGFGCVSVSRIMLHGIGSLAYLFIFLAASYRCVRASFFYHKAKP